MSNDPGRWSDAAMAINVRMRQLGLSQVELTRLSGVSAFTVRRLQNGVAANYRAPNLAKVGLALGWTADSIQRLLDGQEPLDSSVARPAPGLPAAERIEMRVLAHLDALEARLEARIAAVEEKVAGYNEDERDAT